MNEKHLLVISCPVSSRSGYGSHSRDLVRSLIKLDKYDVKILSTRWGNCPQNALTESDADIISRLITQDIDRQPDIWIQVTVPNEFKKVGKYNIGITAGIETTLPDPSWLNGCNNMDLIIVPSQHSKDVLEKAGYDKVDNSTRQKVDTLKLIKPIEILFEGCDVMIYDKKKADDTIKFSIIESELKKVDENFCFLFVGHWLAGDLGHDRKDVGSLIQTFCETFNKKLSNKPALILKTNGATFSIIDRENILSKLSAIRNNIKNAPNVYLLHGDLTDEEMNYLYNHNKVKAHVSFTKGEGFGRPLLEATLSGKPILAPNWSGQVDFLNKEFVTLLPGELKNVHPSAVWKNVILKESKWFYVNYNYASRVMKDVFENYNLYLQKSRKHIQYTKDHFSLDLMTKLFGEILDKYVPIEKKLIFPNLTQPDTTQNKQLDSIEFPKLKKV